MPTPPSPGGPFYFSWANASETTFGATHYAYDETIFSFSISHDEGQIPTLEIEILNPNVGLLNSGRKQWAWFSWWNGSAVVPLFFGRLVGVPTDMLARTVRLQFIARANNYLTRKLNLAQSLKVRPYYDPLFLDEKARNDPDAILEGYSAAWHVDRTSLDWTISDIINPEDGTVTFTESDIFYGSVSIQIGEQPLKTVFVNASASWTVNSSGSVPVGIWGVESWTGDAILSEWPKPGAVLGGGWIAENSWAFDLANTKNAQVVSYSGSYQNRDTAHAEGDTMSSNFSYQRLNFSGRKRRLSYTSGGTTGSIGLIGSENTPNASTTEVEEWALCYSVLCQLSARYAFSAPFSESLQIRVDADIQNVLFDAETEQEAEVIKLTASDPTQSILDYATAAAVENAAVELGRIILDPNGNYQIAVEAGLSGATPSFETAIGAETADLSITWVCLGPNLSPIGDWSASKSYGRGALIAPSASNWTVYSSLVSVGLINHIGTAVSVGTIVKADNGLSFQKCVTAGTTSGWIPAFSSVAGDVTTDGSAEWISLGPTLPSGVVQLCVTAGTTGAASPVWSVSGGTVTDGSVLWASLATSAAYISEEIGYPGIGDAATAFFPTDRGAWAAEYCLMRARAKMLTRARAIQIGWTTTFANGVGLSCRKAAQISDPRIPGGVAEGKVISYALTGDGSSGEFVSQVKIGVAVGNEGTVFPSSGTPAYVSGYVTGYQQAAGAQSVIGSDIGYGLVENPGYSLSPPAISANWVGTAAAQEFSLNGDPPPVYLSLTIPNLEGRQFATGYNLPVTSLKVPKGIDLSAS